MSKGSGGSTQQVQRVEPSELQSPYISDALRQSQDLYNLGPQQFFPGTTFARAGEDTQAAEELLKTAALGQQTSVANALFPAFTGSLMSPSQVLSDPLFQESLAANLRPIEESTSRMLTQARRDAGEAGQLGGTRRAILESEVIKDMLTKESELASKIFGNIYGDLARTRATTLGLSPYILDAYTTPGKTLMNVGAARDAMVQRGIDEAIARHQFGQQAPSDLLDQYMGRVGGQMFGQTTTAEMPGSEGPGGLAGAVGGAGLGSILGGAIAPEATMTALTGLGAGAAEGSLMAGLGAVNPWVAGAALLGGLLG